MQIHYKSLFLGMAVGTILVLAVLFLVSDVETEVIISTGKPSKRIQKELDVKIDKTMQDGEAFTKVTVSGEGSTTQEDVDKVLEQLFQQLDIDKSDSNLEIEIAIED